MAAILFWAAAALAAVFAGLMGQRARSSSSPVYRWWLLSFVLYALAFSMEALTVAHNWHAVWEYQIYIVASAGLVGTMSVGTTYLALPRSKVATGYAIYVAAAVVALAVLTAAFPPVLHGSWQALNAGQHAIVGPTQVAYLLLSAVGGPVVVLGALWSWWKTRRYYTLFIAAGALIPSLSGTLASQGFGLFWFPVLNIVGLTLIFLGYVYSRPQPAPQGLRVGSLASAHQKSSS
ncbi:MAG: hypothetical protein OWU84_13350 [Firmicutes bacterium]|nr:hypothetical protein [Bacillota bacterium]